jgi:hypothetical protein
MAKPFERFSIFRSGVGIGNVIGIVVSKIVHVIHGMDSKGINSMSIPMLLSITATFPPLRVRGVRRGTNAL